MKKSTFMIYLLLFGIIIDSSCTSDFPESINSQKDFLRTDLVSQLQQFNDSLINNYSTHSRSITYSPDSSIDSEYNRKWIKVVWADATGAFSGFRNGAKIGGIIGPHSSIIMGTCCGIIFGTVSSLFAYYDEYKITYDTTETPNNIIKFVEETSKTGEIKNPLFIYKTMVASSNIRNRSFSNSDLDIQSSDPALSNAMIIGRKHNQTIEFVSLCTDLNSIRNIKLDESDSTIIMLQNPEIITKYNQDVENIRNGIVLPSSNLKIDEILELYHQIIAETPNKQHDIPFITNKYVEYIYNSEELSEHEREETYSTLITAAYSSILWEKQEIETFD